MRKGECEDSDDGQQQGSIVNVRFPDDDVDGSWITMIMIVVVFGCGSNHVHGDNEERRC